MDISTNKPALKQHSVTRVLSPENRPAEHDLMVGDADKVIRTPLNLVYAFRRPTMLYKIMLPEQDYDNVSKSTGWDMVNSKQQNEDSLLLSALYLVFQASVN